MFSRLSFNNHFTRTRRRNMVQPRSRLTSASAVPRAGRSRSRLPKGPLLHLWEHGHWACLWMCLGKPGTSDSWGGGHEEALFRRGRSSGGGGGRGNWDAPHQPRWWWQGTGSLSGRSRAGRLMKPWRLLACHFYWQRRNRAEWDLLYPWELLRAPLNNTRILEDFSANAI